MKTCPHCGVSLSEEASFCPHCATSLVEKTALKPYRTLPIRKVLLVLIPLLILGILLLLPWEKALSPAPSENTEISATLTDTDTEITDSASTETESADTDEQTDAVSSESEASTVTEDSAPSTDADTPTDSKMETEQTDSVTDSSTDSVTNSSTDSVTEEISSQSPDEDEIRDIYTPETAPAEGSYLYKGVEWYYESATMNDIGYDKTQYPYQEHEVVIIIGLNSLAKDGIYHVPETIYGRHVMRLVGHVDKEKVRYPFDSPELHENSKAFYFPPGVSGVTWSLFQDTNMTDVYIGAGKFVMNLGLLTKNITVHSTAECISGTRDDETGLVLSMQEYCAEFSDENRRIQWEEWDPATLYPNS